MCVKLEWWLVQMEWWLVQIMWWWDAKGVALGEMDVMGGVIKVDSAIETVLWL